MEGCARRAGAAERGPGWLAVGVLGHAAGRRAVPASRGGVVRRPTRTGSAYPRRARWGGSQGPTTEVGGWEVVI